MTCPRRRQPATLHTLLFGSAGPDAAFRVLALANGQLHSYEPGRGLQRCPDSWAARALVVSGVDGSLVLGDRKPAPVEPAP
jgi:hypothetical protein